MPLFCIAVNGLSSGTREVSNGSSTGGTTAGQSAGGRAASRDNTGAQMVHGTTSVGGHTTTSLSAQGAQLTQDRFTRPTASAWLPARHRGQIARSATRQNDANLRPL
jgi:hypothetical protein